MRALLLLLSSLAALAPGTPAQLRHAIADAPLVVIARHVGVRPLGNDYFLHRYETAETLKGEAPPTFTIAERKRIADLPQPKPGPDRLLCLRPDRGAADLPASFAPYLIGTGHAGGDPVVDEGPATASFRQLVRVLLESERGRGSSRTAADLVELALRGQGPARVEASEALRERTALRDAISSFGRDDLLLAAVGESEDIERKISLASLCAEAGQKGVVEAMCIALQSVDDPRLARAVGRIARHAHGEGAFAVLEPFLRQARGGVHDRLLLAVGATGTDGALAALLALRSRDGASAALDAALRAHGAPRALEAIGGQEPTEAGGQRR
jgi:hypothetical protein